MDIFMWEKRWFDWLLGLKECDKFIIICVLENCVLYYKWGEEIMFGCFIIFDFGNLWFDWFKWLSGWVGGWVDWCIDYVLLYFWLIWGVGLYIVGEMGLNLVLLLGFLIMLMLLWI